MRKIDGAVNFDDLIDKLWWGLLILCSGQSVLGWIIWLAKGWGKKKRFQYCLNPCASNEILYLRAIQGHLGENFVDPLLQDNMWHSRIAATSWPRAERCCWIWCNVRRRQSQNETWSGRWTTCNVRAGALLWTNRTWSSTWMVSTTTHQECRKCWWWDRCCQARQTRCRPTDTGWTRRCQQRGQKCSSSRTLTFLKLGSTAGCAGQLAAHVGDMELDDGAGRQAPWPWGPMPGRDRQYHWKFTNRRARLRCAGRGGTCTEDQVLKHIWNFGTGDLGGNKQLSRWKIVDAARIHANAHKRQVRATTAHITDPWNTLKMKRRRRVPLTLLGTTYPWDGRERNVGETTSLLMNLMSWLLSSKLPVLYHAHQCAGRGGNVGDERLLRLVPPLLQRVDHNGPLHT